ncbi:hypothetical protein L208DRAFT_1382552 [Tricholoma matsutake]|nr:hypothetical protein L208DRAFT_1382552 [Tricholoma matsutake 945]
MPLRSSFSDGYESDTHSSNHTICARSTETGDESFSSFDEGHHSHNEEFNDDSDDSGDEDDNDDEEDHTMELDNHTFFSNGFHIAPWAEALTSVPPDIATFVHPQPTSAVSYPPEANVNTNFSSDGNPWAVTSTAPPPTNAQIHMPTPEQSDDMQNTPYEANTTNFIVPQMPAIIPEIRVPQTSVNMGAYHPKIARLHTGTDQVPSSAPSTAGLMEAVLTYTSTTNEGLDAEDGTITPTPGNPTTGMDSSLHHVSCL